MEKVKNWFAKYGYMVIAANRFLSGTRSVVSLFSGFFHLKWLPVLLFATLSAVIWNGLLIYGGYLLGANWENIKEIISSYNKVVLCITIVAIGIFILIRFLRKRKTENKEI